MAFDILATARNWSIILLALEALLICVVPLFIFVKITQGLRKLHPKVRPALRQGHEGVKKVTGVIERIMASIASPFVWLGSIVAGIRAGVAHVRRTGQ